MAGATSWGCEPAGTSYSWMRGCAGAGRATSATARNTNKPARVRMRAIVARGRRREIMVAMDLLMVAREAPGLAPTPREIDDPAKARQVLPTLPHGPQITPLLARLALGVLILARGLDRGAARAPIGVPIHRARPRAVALLGH